MKYSWYPIFEKSDLNAGHTKFTSLSLFIYSGIIIKVIVMQYKFHNMTLAFFKINFKLLYKKANAEFTFCQSPVAG